MAPPRAFPILLVLAGIATPPAVAAALGDDPPVIVFVRGGLGTTGHLSGAGLDSLSSIFDTLTTPGNHGYAELAALLAADGYVVDEIAEGPLAAPGTADFPAALADTDVLAFTSNNVVYPPAASEALRTWICEGGAAMFSSDGDWGLDWGEAPSSDQSLLGVFDLVMNQDKGFYTLSRSAGDFIVNGVDKGTHPILAGPDGLVGTNDDVNTFDGEGVSALTVTALFDGVTPVILANAKGQKRLNDSPSIGTLVPTTPDDAALVVVEYGAGRVVGHFDRNTFHNVNGSGTDITRHDNAQYARNLFAWLVGAPGTSYGAGCAAASTPPSLELRGCPRSGSVITLDVAAGPPASTAFFVVGLASAEIALPSGCTLLVGDLLPLMPMLALDQNGAANLSSVVPTGVEGIAAFVQVWTPQPGANTLSATGGVQLGFF